MERVGNRITHETILEAAENAKYVISFSDDPKMIPLGILVLLARNVNPDFVLPKEDNRALGQAFLDPFFEILPYTRTYLLGFTLANYKENANEITPGYVDGRQLSTWISAARKADVQWLQKSIARFRNRITREDIWEALKSVPPFTFSNDLTLIPLEILVLLALSINPKFELSENVSNFEAFNENIQNFFETIPYQRLYVQSFIHGTRESHTDDATPGAEDSRELSAWILEAIKRGEQWVLNYKAPIVDQVSNRITRKTILNALEKEECFTISQHAPLALQILKLLARHTEVGLLEPFEDEMWSVEPLAKALPYTVKYIRAFIFPHLEREGGEAQLAADDSRELTAWFNEARERGERWVRTTAFTKLMLQQDPERDVEALSALECQVIQARLVDKQTYAEIGMKLHIGSTRIRKILEKWDRLVKPLDNESHYKN
jgi:hypothetical protein